MNRPGVFEFIGNLRLAASASDSDSEVTCSESDSDSNSELTHDENSGDEYEEQSSDDSEELSEATTFSSRNRQRTWSTKQPEQRGRRSVHNILRETAGPAPHVQPNDMISCWSYFFTDDMIHMIVKYTNKEAERHDCSWHPTDRTEICAFVGILYNIGVLKGWNERLSDFWDSKFGHPAIMACMSRNRFHDLLKYLRFDDGSTRQQRRENDRLAPIRDLWELFLRNCRRCIIPSAFLCVDEQLLPTRGRCPLRVYMPQKPHKYGIKIWMLADSELGYFIDGDVYLRRHGGESREVDQGERVVLQLCERYFNSGRNITCDRFFTSPKLAEKLYQNGLTMIGTINKTRAEIPKELSIPRNRELYSSIFTYCDKMQLTSYKSKRSKCVLILSTLHNSNAVDDEVDKKPHCIIDYNRTKFGVDVVDHMVNAFTVRRKIKRWPVTIFFNILDLCAMNAFITWLLKQPSWMEHRKASRRSFFLKELSLSLMTPVIEARKSNHPIVKKCRLEIIPSLTDVESEQSTSHLQPDQRGRCFLCSKRKRIFNRCHACYRHVCSEHCKPVCDQCRRAD